MKHTLCFIAAMAGAFAAPASAHANASPATRTTSKSLDAFGQCFVSMQKRASRPWWFVPNQRGGTFSNSGSRLKEGTYFLRVRKVGPALQLTLETFNNKAALTGLENVVDHCA